MVCPITLNIRRRKAGQEAATLGTLKDNLLDRVNVEAKGFFGRVNAASQRQRCSTVYVCSAAAVENTC